MVTRDKGIEEIGAFMPSRGGISFRDFWNLDKVQRRRWDCGKFL
jgi:hypothetical protein